MQLRSDTGKNSVFANIPNLSRPRNLFPMYERHTTTMQFDKLFPIFHDWIYPGDTISGQLHFMARLQTQATYLFDDLYLDFHAWFDPHRNVQTNWARYQFNYQETPSQDNGSLTSPAVDFTVSTGTVFSSTTGFIAKELYDYFKYPTEVNLSASTQKYNNYLARHYNNIWDKAYRDQNWMSAPTLDRDDGPDNPNDYALRYRGKRFDWLMSGTKAVMKSQNSFLGAPVIGTSPVVSTGAQVLFDTIPSTSSRGFYGESGTTNTELDGANFGAQTPLMFGSTTGLQANLTSGLAYMLVNDLRSTVSVQHFYENDSIGGTRDIESIKHRWGVTVPDFRLVRPEYLGGATFRFDGHIVPQTSETASTPQGTLTSFSQLKGALNITHSFVEHGNLIVLVSARSNMTYQQGIEREATARTRLDWYQPEFAHVGNVAILAREVYVSGTDANDINPFLYNEYGYWLRYTRSFVTAEMRSNYATSLDSRHMAYDFVAPVADASFFNSFTPIVRNIVVDPDDADPIELHTIFEGRMARVLPVNSIPGLTRL